VEKNKSKRGCGWGGIVGGVKGELPPSPGNEIVPIRKGKKERERIESSEKGPRHAYIC
jgi:hypothetical protein